MKNTQKFGTLFACAMAFSAALGFSDVQAVAAPAKIRVMVYNGAYTSLPVHVANDMGFYKRNGLEAETVTVNSGPAGVAALLGGSIDFVEPPTDQIIENVVKGTGLKIVVGNEIKNFYTVMGADRTKFPNLDKGFVGAVKDMKGMKIGVNSLGATTQLMMNAMLRDAGLTQDDITYVAVGSATTALAAWQAKRVDVQVAFTPFPEIVEALGSGFPIVDLSKGQGPKILQKLGGAFEAFSTSTTFIKQHPQTVSAFIEAHKEAIEWMKDPANHDQLAKLVGKYVNVAIIPEQSRAKTIDLMIKNYTSYLGYTVDRNAISAWNQYLLDNKLISRAVKADEVIYTGAPKP